MFCGVAFWLVDVMLQFSCRCAKLRSMIAAETLCCRWELRQRAMTGQHSFPERRRTSKHDF